MPQTAEEIVREFIERCVNRRELKRTRRFWTADGTWHGTAFGETSGLAEFEEALERFLTAFPDLRLKIEDAVARDDRVALRLTLTGTHEGEFIGVPPTGRSVEFAAIAFFRLEGDRIAEEWFSGDVYGLQCQLTGAASSLAPAP
jgi:steroid delta-isomerase-like uncharacterized protein